MTTPPVNQLARQTLAVAAALAILAGVLVAVIYLRGIPPT